MAAYTLTVARTRARTHHLDDDGTRWSDTETDEALEAALSSCMDEYIQAGGDHWRTESGDVTTDSSGQYDMSSLDPLIIHGVSFKSGNLYYPLPKAQRSDLRRGQSTALTLKIFYTPQFAFPTTGSNALIGDTVTLMPYKAFEEWVCCRAALIMAAKDDERLAALERVEQMLRQSVMGRLTVTSSRRPSLRSVGWAKWYAWDWEPRQQYVSVVNQAAWGYF